MKLNSYKGFITKLAENEVFVFGSNLEGWHGSGSAGYATFNEIGNIWRDYDYQDWPNGKKGKWNKKGIGEGFQIGEIGKSYALPTVTKAGYRRSRTPLEIIISIGQLYQFAAENRQYKFYIAQEGSPGLNGYSPEEMGEFFAFYERPPENCYFNENFIPFVERGIDLVRKMILDSDINPETWF